MKLYRSLVYREFRLSRKYYILITLLFVLLEALVLLGIGLGLEDEESAETVSEKLAGILVTSIVPALAGFLCARDANNYKKDVHSGWASYARVLPATAKQRAFACILLRLGFSLFIGLPTVVLSIVMQSITGFNTLIPTLSVFLAAMALTVLLDAVYSAVVMRTTDQKAFKTVAFIAFAAVAGVAALVSKLIGRGENGELLDDGLLDKIKDPKTARKLYDFVTSYAFLGISLAAAAVAFVVYFIVVSKSLERREA